MSAANDRFIPLIPIGLGLVLVVMGASFGAVGRHQLLKSQAMLAWPETEGTVLSSFVSPYRQRGEAVDRYRLSTTYRYEVSGKSYEFSATEQQGTDAEEVGRQVVHVSGQKVPIYYDPNDPVDRVLARESGPVDVVFLGIAVFCGLLSVPFFAFGMRLRRQRLAPQ